MLNSYCLLSYEFVYTVFSNFLSRTQFHLFILIFHAFLVLASFSLFAFSCSPSVIKAENMLTVSPAEGLNLTQKEYPGYDTKLYLVVRGSSFEALENMDYSFISITPRSTLTQSGSTFFGPIYWSVWKLLVLDKNTQNHSHVPTNDYY